MSRARTRSPASFSDSDEEDESESYSDSDEEDESESYSDSSTTSTKACGACLKEIAELKKKLSVCESYQREMDKMLRHQIGMNGSMMEMLNGVNLQFKKNNEMFKQTRKKLKRNRKKFKQNQEIQQSMMKTIVEIKFVLMMALWPPEHLQQQQQQPLQPAAAATTTLQPQPKHGRARRKG